MSDENNHETSTCTNCGRASFLDATQEIERVFGPFRYVQSVSVRRCQDCGEWFAPGPVVEAFEDAVTRALVDQGVADPSALVRLRRTAGLRVAALADLLGVKSDTVAAWEDGACAIDRANLLTLGALALDALADTTTTRDRLIAASRAQPGTTRVRAA